MKTARCAVFYNSSSSVLSVLKGIPTFVSEESAVTWDVANHNIKNILNPFMPDRTQWFNNLSQAHWTIDPKSCRVTSISILKSIYQPSIQSFRTLPSSLAPLTFQQVYTTILCFFCNASISV